MAYFETVIVQRRDLTQNQADDAIKNFEKLLKDHKCDVFHKENWGLLSLAYPINKNKKAYYHLIRFEGENSAVLELERNLRITDDCIRYMTVSLSSKDKEASPMTRYKKEEVKEEGEE